MKLFLSALPTFVIHSVTHKGVWDLNDVTQADEDGYLIMQLHKSAWAANDYCWANKPDVWQFIWQSSGTTYKKQERLSYISPPSTFAHTKHRTWYISLTSRVSYRIHCQGVILITYQYDEDVVFAGKAIHPSIRRIQDVFLLFCYFLYIAIKNMMRALLLQKEVIRPSIHPIIRRMQRLPKKQLSFQINANQCIFSSNCKFRFSN